MIHDRSPVAWLCTAPARLYRGAHEPSRYTLHAFNSQCKKRVAPYWSGVQTPAMPTVSASSRQLKLLRQRAGLSIREVAQQLGMEHGSSYQHYEDRFKKPLLPLELVMKLVPIFEAGGVEPSELYALAGVNATGERPLVATSPTRAPTDARTIRIEELDVRASAGAGLTGENEKVVAEWQVPSGVVRGYSTAPATEMRIITVMGDSMEPALLPGQRVLVDTGDRKPSPPGIFVVWDGLGLVIKRVQMVPHSEPPRVKITSDNVKYESYERSLEEAYIQGRVIGQWRWL
jgi:phage repressor protein C with HTH and peptisase S24 domain